MTTFESASAISASGQEESVAGHALSRTIAAALGGRQARKVIVSRPNAQLHAILAESVDIVPGDVICHSMLFFFAVACRSSQVPFGPMFSTFASPRDTRSYPWVCHPQEPVAMQQIFVAYVEPRKFTGLSPDQGASQCQTNSKEEGSALLATLQ